MKTTTIAISAFLIAMLALMVPMPPANALLTSGVLKTAGSSTVLPVSQDAEIDYENWMLSTQGMTIDAQIAGGGSGAGFSQILGGTIDVGASSRPPTTAEWNNTNGANLRIWAIGIDSIAIIVPVSNNWIHNVTGQQVSDLFSKYANGTAVYTYWDDFAPGAPHQVINRAVRDLTSGTHECFRNNFLTPFGRTDANLANNIEQKTNNIDVYNLMTSPAGQYYIAYIGLGFLHLGGLTSLWIYNAAKSDYIEPTDAHVKDGSYPPWRWLWYMTIGVPRADTDDKAKSIWISFVRMNTTYMDREGYIQMVPGDFAGASSGDVQAPIHPSIPDGKLTSADTFYFIDAFIAYWDPARKELNPYADFNADGQINSVDVFAYLDAYAAFYS
jgi:ABC-type phosphate transport system substrate-binding protein